MTTTEPLDLVALSAIWTTFAHLSPHDIETLYPAFSPSVQRHLDMMVDAIHIGVAPSPLDGK